MKKVVIACDSFKESMSAIEACQAIQEGILKVNKNIDVQFVPMADGGEGTIDVISYVTKGQFMKVSVHGPMHELIEAKYWLLEDQKTAFIEVAEACGIQLVSIENRNPLKASSYGVGELILDALRHGVKRIYVGLGGSVTNDGGLGLLRALDAKFYDSSFVEITEIEDLVKLKSVDFSHTKKLLKNCEIIVMSDVDNPFVGNNGATYVFGRQKGATDQQLDILEKALVAYNEVIKNQLHIDLAATKKTGAAGGIGGAFYLIGGSMQSGIDTILELIDFKNKIKDANYVITGEGSIDSQTANGKTISGILKMTRQYHIPVIAFAGRVTSNIQELYDLGLTAAFSITNEAKSLQQALSDGKVSLMETAYNVFRLIENK